MRVCVVLAALASLLGRYYCVEERAIRLQQADAKRAEAVAAMAKSEQEKRQKQKEKEKRFADADCTCATVPPSRSVVWGGGCACRPCSTL